MVDVSLVKQLREMTGAGMMDCKKALAENGDNLDAACDWLRKQGIAAAAKKGGRVAAEGLIALRSLDNQAIVAELNSETDFVAKNDSFKDLAATVLDSIAGSTTNDVAELTVNGKALSEEVTNAISVIGENIQLRRFDRVPVDNGFVASYLHSAVSESLGRIGVLVSITCDKVTDEARNLGKQIAMHVAANKPVAAKQEDVPAELVAREKAIFSEQAQASGKPAEIIEKMVEGRVRKYYEEVVLVEQAFVIDGKTPIKEVIAAFEKENGCNFKVNSFIRYEVGEGIEKAEDDFADEVQSIVANS